MTPRTDREIWWVGFKPDERLEAVWADFARDLEKENAALNEATRKHVEAYYELLAENNALRKALGEAFAESDDTVRFHIIRNAVEALKEAQP
jgi:hypothetical protein